MGCMTSGKEFGLTALAPNHSLRHRGLAIRRSSTSCPLRLSPMPHAVAVSGQYQYRLYGKRGSVTYLSFGCYCGSRPGLGSTDPTHLDSSELVTQPDGSFEVSGPHQI